MKKKYIVLGVLVAAVAGAWYFTPSLESIVKTLVHKYGSQVTGTDVNLEGFDLSLKNGEGKIKKITVANPEGYKKPYILSLDGITVKVDLKSLTSDTIIIEKVQIDKPVVTYEMLSLTQNNIKQLQENIKHFTDSGKSASADAKEAQPAEETKEGGKKVIIKSLTVNNGELQAAANIAGNSPDMSVKLPTIQMNNIGAAKNGDSITQTITKIFNQILSTASATVVSSNLSNLKDVATENLNNVVGGVKDRVKNIGIFGK